MPVSRRSRYAAPSGARSSSDLNPLAAANHSQGPEYLSDGGGDDDDDDYAEIRPHGSVRGGMGLHDIRTLMMSGSQAP